MTDAASAAASLGVPVSSFQKWEGGFSPCPYPEVFAAAIKVIPADKAATEPGFEPEQERAP
jgi:hypothetical protein